MHGLQPSDDHPHPRGIGESWQENYLFMGMSDDASTAMYVHVARLPHHDACDVKLAVKIGDQVGSFTTHLPWSDDLSVAGFRFSIEEPWARWHVRAEGTGVTGAAGSLLTLQPGDVPLSAEFAWEAKVPPLIQSEGFAMLSDAGAGSSGHHYIQGGRWVGVVRLGDRSAEAAGWSIRDHTWGERNLPNMDHCWWTPMVLADGGVELGGIDMHTKDGARTSFAFRRDGDRQVTLPHLTVDVVEGSIDDFAVTSIACGDDVRVTARRLVHMPIAYYRGGGVGWVSDDALCVIEADDGSTGFGIIELNRAMTPAEVASLPESLRS